MIISGLWNYVAENKRNLGNLPPVPDVYVSESRCIAWGVSNGLVWFHLEALLDNPFSILLQLCCLIQIRLPVCAVREQVWSTKARAIENRKKSKWKRHSKRYLVENDKKYRQRRAILSIGKYVYFFTDGQWQRFLQSKWRKSSTINFFRKHWGNVIILGNGHETAQFSKNGVFYTISIDQATFSSPAVKNNSVRNEQEGLDGDWASRPCTTPFCSVALLLDSKSCGTALEGVLSTTRPEEQANTKYCTRRLHSYWSKAEYCVKKKTSITPGTPL